jgi:hypothetical protein
MHEYGRYGSVQEMTFYIYLMSTDQRFIISEQRKKRVL